ncbi:hypothetical protein [Paenibacillus sp. LPE1-1-1.1]|uniref:hypothetical protein n=1 Tax=Paenibacillus sp. LPE1-1-1.1 TaxID=3135230 RepID=UPI0034396BB4
MRSLLYIKKSIYRLGTIVIAALFLLSSSKAYAEEAQYSSRLYTPTFITKISGIYFIVDCWNHRIIYSRNMNEPISKWKTLDDDIAGPHSIAGNGTTFIAEDTGRNRLFVYTLTPKGFKKTQIIDGIAIRPHRTIYDPSNMKFYTLSANSQTMYVLKNDKGVISVERKLKLDFQENTYTRSFSIINGEMYFVSGPGKVSVVNYKDDSFEVIKQYRVPDEYAAMNDIKKLGDFYYITVYPKKIVRLKDLSDFNKAENIYDVIGFKGTPYYMSYFDGRIFIPEIDSNSGIKSFVLRANEIKDVKTLNDSGPPNDAVIQRSKEIAT